MFWDDTAWGWDGGWPPRSTALPMTATRGEACATRRRSRQLRWRTSGRPAPMHCVVPADIRPRGGRTGHDLSAATNPHRPKPLSAWAT